MGFTRGPGWGIETWRKTPQFHPWKKKKKKKMLFVSLNVAFVAAGLGEPASDEL